MKRWIKISFAAILSVALLTGCSLTKHESTESDSQSGASPDNSIQNEDKIDLIMQEMTLKEKIGQMIIVRPDALDFSQTIEQIKEPTAVGVTELSTDMSNVLKEYPVGGIVMFSKNISSPKQISEFNNNLQNSSKIPLFMSIDEEGGIVARIANNNSFDVPHYESAASVGESGDTSDAINMGTTIGAYLYQYGFNMDFAPVADVNSNPNNPIIGERAFSADAEVASKMAKSMAEGLKGQRIIPTFKHFPGHGDTGEDSHKGIAVSYKTKTEMESCEWIPYESLSDDVCVMVGHISTPELTGNLIPSSMSYEIVTGILRQQLGFEGVVVTDSLEMNAITNDYSAGESAINAVNAGCDIILCPDNLQESFAALVEAVENGNLSEERINESVYRILSLKQRYGLLTSLLH